MYINDFITDEHIPVTQEMEGYFKWLESHQSRVDVVRAVIDRMGNIEEWQLNLLDVVIAQIKREMPRIDGQQYNEGDFRIEVLREKCPECGVRLDYLGGITRTAYCRCSNGHTPIIPW